MLTQFRDFLLRQLARHACTRSGRPVEIIAVYENHEGRVLYVEHDDGKRDFLLEREVVSWSRMMAYNATLLLILALSGLLVGVTLVH